MYNPIEVSEVAVGKPWECLGSFFEARSPTSETQQTALKNYRYHVEVGLRHVMLYLYLEYGTILSVIIEALAAGLLVLRGEEGMPMVPHMVPGAMPVLAPKQHSVLTQIPREPNMA